MDLGSGVLKNNLLILLAENGHGEKNEGNFDGKRKPP